MRTSDLIKSKYWRASDLEGQPPCRLTIVAVTEEIMGRGRGLGGMPESKFFLWFNEHQKGLQLNKTRIKILEAAFGPDTDGWEGKRVHLYFDPTVEFGARRVGGIGIRTPPGVVYHGQAAAAGWGDPPPPGAPPPPVWNAATQTWDVKASQPAATRQPPHPVWNPATNTWDVVNPSTGEVAPPAPRREAPPPTISQRAAATFPPGGAADDWGTLPPAESGEDPEFGHADIPF